MVSRIYTNATVATLSDKLSKPYGLLEQSAVVVIQDRIDWVGKSKNLPQTYQNFPREDLGGKLITPALIDCHTHLVYGGSRAKEFEMRLEGASYEEIAKAGGGILSTVTATRNTSEEELINSALPRLDALLAEGVCVVEIKSGYGLSIEDELKMLRAARKLETLRDVKIKTTYLAAHAIPPEYKKNSDSYIDEVVLPGLTQAAEEGLVDAVDAFCEGIAFSPDQVDKVFQRATALGIPVKLHAEQLSNLKGTELAARYQALSADHLEYLDLDGVKAMKEAGTVAVLLPGAFYTLRETKLPPIEDLRSEGVPIALATDCNPGSSPIMSLLLIMNMACTLFRLTPEEALNGVTKNAAKALGLGHEKGTIEAGKDANFLIWDITHPAELAYQAGFNPLFKVVRGEFE
ncbi:imidazolonepropionase [Sneathiella limimaris]|uniref:imidazolonepropionase n=1 Tax=Sneathiella limimaris TaxID=1964213 RepID=UPI00146DB354